MELVLACGRSDESAYSQLTFKGIPASIRILIDSHMIRMFSKEFVGGYVANGVVCLFPIRDTGHFSAIECQVTWIRDKVHVGDKHASIIGARCSNKGYVN